MFLCQQLYHDDLIPPKVRIVDSTIRAFLCCCSHMVRIRKTSNPMKIISITKSMKSMFVDFNIKRNNVSVNVLVRANHSTTFIFRIKGDWELNFCEVKVESGTEIKPRQGASNKKRKKSHLIVSPFRTVSAINSLSK